MEDAEKIPARMLQVRSRLTPLLIDQDSLGGNADTYTD
jgi:hypothetical protein